VFAVALSFCGTILTHVQVLWTCVVRTSWSGLRRPAPRSRTDDATGGGQRWHGALQFLPSQLITSAVSPQQACANDVTHISACCRLPA